MSMLVTSQTTKNPGPDARINCPACGPIVPARTYRTEERRGLFFIPLLTQRETWVECVGCGSSRQTRLPLEKLGDYQPDELTFQLHQRVSIIVKCLAVASVMMSWLPIVGLCLGVVALIATYRAGGWTKVASVVEIVLGSLATAFAVVQVLTDP